MPSNKPSEAEEEYFRKEELERIKRMRQKLDEERRARMREQERQSHWMRCPKCGAKMEEVLFRHVMVDRCTECGYVGFDHGELDLLLSDDQPLLARFGSELRKLFSLGKVEDPKLGD